MENEHILSIGMGYRQDFCLRPRPGAAPAPTTFADSFAADSVTFTRMLSSSVVSFIL